jgi:hypothetical protein
MSDVSIDPIVRMKAEKILRDQKPNLEVIQEEGRGGNGSLTVNNLSKLNTIENLDTKSMASKAVSGRKP